jgi:hypothetical protein
MMTKLEYIELRLAELYAKKEVMDAYKYSGIGISTERVSAMEIEMLTAQINILEGYKRNHMPKIRKRRTGFGSEPGGDDIRYNAEPGD